MPFFHLYFYILKKIYIKSHSKTSLPYTPFMRNFAHIFSKNKDQSNSQNLITTYPFPRTLFSHPFSKNCSHQFSKPDPKQFPNTHYHIPLFSPLFLYLKKIHIKSHSKTSLPYALFHPYFYI